MTDTPAPQGKYDDMVLSLEVVASGGNGAELVDLPALLEKAAAAITALQNRIALDAGLAEGYKRVIADLQQQVREERVPEGYAVVPVEPTEEMLDSASWTDATMAAIYRAMIEATKKPARVNQRAGE